MEDPTLNALFVGYKFLDVPPEETETPNAIKIHDPNEYVRFSACIYRFL